MAFDADGTYQAATIDLVQDIGAYPIPWPVFVSAAVGMIFPGPYRLPNATFSTKCVFTNTAGRTAYRGPWQFETVAREMMLDIAARRLGVDPVELRRRNLLRKDEMPYANAGGMTYSDVTPLETFDLALEKIGYDEFRRRQADGARRGSIPRHRYQHVRRTDRQRHGAAGQRGRDDPDRAHRARSACTWRAARAGNSLETTAIQLTADALGVDISTVHTIQGDTALTPYGAGTGGSRSGSMVAGAVRDTAAVLRERIAAIAAHVLEASPDDIVIANGRASVTGSPTPSLTIAEIADLAYFGKDKLPLDVPMGLEASARYRAEAFNVWANATHVCTCEVDLATGHVELLRYVVAEDCGPMINPNVVEGQIAGGTVQGIGGVLLEDFAVGRRGQPASPPRSSTTCCPRRRRCRRSSSSTPRGSPGPGPGGYKGVGEGGAIGAPAAVANAIADALAPLGVTITRLPLTPGDDRGADRRGAGGDGGRTMKPAPFDYHAPDTIDGGLQLLAELGDDAKVLAGGQSLIPMLSLRLAVFEHLVDLRRVEELAASSDATAPCGSGHRHHAGHGRASTLKSPGACPCWPGPSR